MEAADPAIASSCHEMMPSESMAKQSAHPMSHDICHLALITTLYQLPRLSGVPPPAITPWRERCALHHLCQLLLLYTVISFSMVPLRLSSSSELIGRFRLLN